MTIQQSLEQVLRRLQTQLGLSLNLDVQWQPNSDGDLCGEIKNGTIFVYEITKDKAIATLIHEVVDFCISEAIEPYRKVTNMLIQILNTEAYRRKERIVDALIKLINTNT
jgi:hypothetical protein